MDNVIKNKDDEIIGFTVSTGNELEAIANNGYNGFEFRYAEISRKKWRDYPTCFVKIDRQRFSLIDGKKHGIDIYFTDENIDRAKKSLEE